jgi:hypothetical protein
VSVLLNWRASVLGGVTPPLPVNGSAVDLRLANVTFPSLITVPAVAANLTTHLIGSVMGISTAVASYELRVLSGMTWADASPTTTDPLPKLTSYTTVGSGLIRVRIPLATSPRAVTAGLVRPPTGSQSFLRYSVYLMDRSNTTAAPLQLRSRCGARRATLVYTSSTALTTSTNTIDIKAPRPTARYSLVVMAEAVWRTTVSGRTVDEPATAGYLLYTQLDDVRPGTYTPEPDDESSTGTVQPPPVQASSGGLSTAVVAVIIVAALAVTGVGGWLLYMRCVRKVAATGPEMGFGLLDSESLHSSLPSDTFVQPSEPSASMSYTHMGAEGAGRGL